MAKIIRIHEFTFQGDFGDSQITVYYESGRQFKYSGKDALPMPVVEFLTSEKTVSNTTYIPYRNKINKRTIYKQ